MTKQVRRLAQVVLALFGLLFVNLNLITLVNADDYANHPSNRRVIIREYSIERGPIVVDEEAIASSIPTDGEFRYLRTYADGELYAHLTGYYSHVLGRSGLESALNQDLTGQPTEVIAQNLSTLLGRAERPGNAVLLTVSGRTQAAARRALAGREGAIVVLDVRTGGVVASYAEPTYDPTPLSSHSRETIDGAWRGLLDDPARPLVDRATREVHPPGSTFKLIVAAAALERGIEPETAFPDERVFDVPLTTADIGNFGGGTCAGGGTIDLAAAFRVSCNTVFARLGVELGEDAVRAQAERFGFNATVPYELPVVRSVFPEDLDVPSLAQSSIGQRDVRVTAMQMAIVAATIVDGGELLRPHVVEQVRDPDGRLVRGPVTSRWTGQAPRGRAVSERTARLLRTMMIDAVESGTGRRAAIDGVVVGGKTGTAQTGGSDVAWFVGFADDRYAIAVVVPDVVGDDATGGRVAAPIAREVLLAALGR
jgi:peptidoglycan glycosyltransferase